MMHGTKGWGGLAIDAGIIVALLFGFAWFHPWSPTVETLPVQASGKAVKVDDDLASNGKALAESNGCTGCHTIDGGSGAGPTWKNLWGAQGKRGTTVDLAYIQETMSNPKPAMLNFKGKFTEAQTAALAEYIKSLSN